MYVQFTSCIYGDYNQTNSFFAESITTLNYSINKDVVVFTYFSFSID